MISNSNRNNVQKNIINFSKMFSDKRIINFKKLKYKYPNGFEDFILMLKSSYYESLPINNLQKII